MEFPLKADFFPQVRLANDEKRAYLTTVETSVKALRRAIQENEWKKLPDRNGMALGKIHCIDEQNHAPGTAAACVVVCATVYTVGTISEVLEAIASPVTEDYRRAMKFLYKGRFLDGVCLHTMASHSARNPQAFTTIKWAAFDDGKALNKPQMPVGTDYCFLEHSGIQKDEAKDELFGFCIQESIPREGEVPPLMGFGLDRGELHRTGIIIQSTDRRDIVQVSSVLQMSFANCDSAASKVVLEKLMEKRVSAISRIELLLERRRLNKMQFVARDEWVKNDQRKACVVCMKPFSLRRKHHCRACGEVVCSSCAPSREVDVVTTANGASVSHVRICTACVMQARTCNQQQPNSQDVFVYHIRSTVSSRTSTNSSIHSLPVAELEQRQSTLSDDSNFSISSESEFSDEHEHHQHPHPHHNRQHLQIQSQPQQQTQMPPFVRVRPRRANTGSSSHRDSASSSSSDYSLSDMDVFDENLHRQHQRMGTGATAAARAYASMAAPVQPSAKRVLYNPSKSKLYPSAAVHPIRTDPPLFSNRMSETRNAESLQNLLLSIQDMKVDLSLVHDMYGQSSAPTPVPHPPPTPVAPAPVSRAATSPFSRQRMNELYGRNTRTTSASSDTTTVDIDMVNSDSFTLISNDVIARQQRGSCHNQEAGEGARRSTRVSSTLSDVSTSTLMEDEHHEQEEEDTPEVDDDTAVRELQSLRQQVDGLNTLLADATSKLNYFQTRALVQQQVESLEAQMSAAPRPSRSHLVDPVLVQRKQSFQVLLAELHEIMGLPALSSSDRSTMENMLTAPQA